MSETPPDLDALAQACAGRLEVLPALSRLDGLVWGLCAAGETRGDALLETACVPGHTAQAGALLRSRAGQLFGAVGLPDPLLPTDDAPLTDRALCLADWCRGVLDGVHGVPEQAAAMSGAALEAYGDLDAMARTGHAGRGHAEEDAYSTLVEHARVTVALLAAELAPLATPPERLPPPEDPDARH